MLPSPQRFYEPGRQGSFPALRAQDHAVREGGLAGLCLALADCLASGIPRTPWKLVLASLAAGALGGLLAGALAKPVRRRGVALGLVLAGGIGLVGLSTVSKEIEAPGARALGAGFVLVLAALTLVESARVARDGLTLSWSWLVLAAVPSCALLLHFLERWPAARLLVLLLPLIVLELAGALGPRRKAAARALAVLSVPLLAAPVTVAERSPARAPLAPAARLPADPARANVVLVVIDTLRADAVPEGGELARFAHGGVEFRRAVSAAPWTLPSIGSLLSGLHPSQHGAVAVHRRLPEEIETWAEILRAHGYATAAFTGGAFVGANHGLDQGFESFDPLAERRFASFRIHDPLVWRLARNRFFPARWFVRWVDEFRGLAGVLDAALHWGEEREERERPFFLFLHTYQVHDYYLYDPDVDDGVLARVAPPSARFAGRLSVHPSELAEAEQSDLDYFRALYDGRVASIDALWPEVERAVAEISGDRPVLWLVTADHGEGFDAALGRVHHGGRLHEDLLRVPLFLRLDGRLPSGKAIDEPVSTTDLLPTVLELCGIESPSGLAGRSLVAAIRGETTFPADAWSEERVATPQRALHHGRWKRIETAAGEECFDLDADPLERTSVREAPPELRSAFAEFEQRFPARAARETELDDATLEHLRALGYVR